MLWAFLIGRIPIEDLVNLSVAQIMLNLIRIEVGKNYHLNLQLFSLSTTYSCSFTIEYYLFSLNQFSFSLEGLLLSIQMPIVQIKNTTQDSFACMSWKVPRIRLRWWLGVVRLRRGIKVGVKVHFKLDHEHTKKKYHIIMDLRKTGDWTRILRAATWICCS